MWIALDQIPPRGRQVTAQRTDGWALRAALGAVGCTPGDLGFTADLRRTAEGATVNGHIRCSYPAVCDRCARDLVVVIDGPFVGRYHAPGSSAGGSSAGGGALGVSADDAGLELSANELDATPLDGEQIDLAEVLAEHLALALPLRVLCEAAGTARVSDDEGPCMVPTHDGGPDLRAQSVFAKLTLPE